MSEKLIQEMGKTHAMLAKVGLLEEDKYGKDFDEAKEQFNMALEGIKTDGMVPDSKEAKAYDKAIDFYDKLNPEEAQAPETPEAQEKPAASTGKGKGKDKATPAKAPAKTAGKDKATPAKAPAPKKPTGPKKPGVVDTIFEELAKASKTKPITKAAIHKVLVKRFPDRIADKMMVSINTVVTPKEIDRLRELNLVVIKDERPWKFYLGK